MSKLIALIFGLFLFIWVVGFVLILLVVLSRKIFTKKQMPNASDWKYILLWPFVPLSGSKGIQKLIDAVFK